MTKVKVHFFKPSGKWYDTHEIKWIEKGITGHEKFKHSLREANIYKNMIAVCVESPAGYPLMIKEK
ncbi:MAG: hypothetical protein ACOC4M_16005, partial [Promethearchaeia archaeon]